MHWIYNVILHSNIKKIVQKVHCSTILMKNIYLGINIYLQIRKIILFNMENIKSKPGEHSSICSGRTWLSAFRLVYCNISLDYIYI